MASERGSKCVSSSLIKLLLGELETMEGLFSNNLTLEKHTCKIGQRAGKRLMLR